MIDLRRSRREWAARDRMLRRRQTRQVIGVILATVTAILALVGTLVWFGLLEAG